jgi:hypothetical protein
MKDHLRQTAQDTHNSQIWRKKQEENISILRGRGGMERKNMDEEKEDKAKEE